MTLKYHIYILMLAACAVMTSCNDNTAVIDGGIYKGDMEDGIPSGYGMWQHGDTVYTGFWSNGKQNGQGLVRYGDYTYRGSFKDGLFDGTGVMAYGDSVIYSGNWSNGKRSGTGIVTDSLARSIVGTWSSDSLICGMRTDDDGTYKGTFNENLMASGSGVIMYDDATFYKGLWKDDRAEGLGMQFAPDGCLRVGIWKKGKFKGEVLNYTADRIYGIDISRYQHKGAFNWNDLRITHLGSLSKKKITGKVDYPVSFVYIKCTEGTTVTNTYYTSDYSKARKNKISCGAYHFFSIHSDAREQALHFLKHLKLNKGDFAPVLDVEPSEKDIKSIGGNRELFRRIRIWLETVEEFTGMRPVLYINQMFINRHLPYAPDIKKKYDVWIARYGEYKPDVRLVHWQLAPDGRVKGISGDVDINVFNGYRPAYERYLRTKTFKNNMPDDKLKDITVSDTTEIQ